MKKSLSALLLVVFLVPSIAFASWWNPLSWFNNWKFNKQEPQVQILEERIKELEKKLEVNPNESTDVIENVVLEETTEEKIPEFIPDKIPEKEKLPVQVTQTPTVVPAPVVIQQPTAQLKLDPYEVRCEINTKKDIKRGDIVTANLSALTRGISSYDVVWDKTYLTKIIKFNEASFTFDTIGAKKVFATVTRKSDNATGEVFCVDTFIACDGYYCLDERGKKKYKLQAIINEVETWYDGTYSYLSTVERCNISESIIRALEYDYALIGGVNLPVFSKVQDCSNSVAPRAYQYKIQLLMDSL